MSNSIKENMFKYLLNFLWPQTRTVTVITVGNNQFPATPKMIKSIAESIASQNTIVWNHTLDIRTVQVPYDSPTTFYDKKDQI